MQPMTLVNAENILQTGVRVKATDAAATGANTRKRTALRVTLWTVQVLLAGLFLLAGVMKLVMSAEAMQAPEGAPSFPLLFLRFIGVVETLGALGLILPGLFRIKTSLTPLAAAGLVSIMIGATSVALSMGVSAALLPFLSGCLAAFVAYGRWRMAPLPTRVARA